VNKVLVVNSVVALSVWLAGFAVFGRFIAPRWKVWGKLGFYLGVSILLSIAVGYWALVWIIGHPGLGVAGHVWWCRKSGIHWVTCQPRGRYLALRPWATTDGFGGRE
jgi:hypothetical protein